jgi:putative DNA primase/helicase
VASALRRPFSLRYSQQPYQDKIVLPAMISGVQGPNERVIAVQLTWLDQRTHERVARSNVGKLEIGAVRLAPAQEVLGLAEGVETALAAMQIHKVPVWATLGAPRMSNVFIPEFVRELIVFGDNDGPGSGAASAVAKRHAPNRRVIECYPPGGFKDWADVTASGR